MNRSKFKCAFHCGTCNELIYKNKSQTKKIARGVAFCSLKCLGEYNGKVRKNQIKKNCLICKEEYEVIPSLAEKSVTCSVDCQKKWQSTFLVGEKANNYRGGNRVKPCLQCEEDFTCSKPYEYKNRKFCSVECKRAHWVANTLHNESFKKSWFGGNLKSRQRQSQGKETLPEKMVREWLEQNNIFFIQEQGFFRKYFADFYLPESKLIIEVMGDYWHGNPLIYGDNKKSLNNEQKDRIEKDKLKKQDFIKFGFRYIELWETEIYHDVNKLLSEIFPATTTRETP